jgi:hypothetical protein
MPLTIPPFAQYNAPLTPLRGLWNNPPPEGDMFVSAEIDWLVSPPANAVQFSLSGNSPVAISQIVALAVDNGRCGADVSLEFPDTGFELVVAARNQGVYPVFTNALMFYAIAPAALLGDVTILQILNSMPPPIPIAASTALNHASIADVPLQTPQTTVVIPATTNGTLRQVAINVDAVTTTTTGDAVITLKDGTGAVLWQTEVSQAASTTQLYQFNVPINVRFSQGVTLTIGESGFTGNWVMGNLYYSTP